MQTVAKKKTFSPFMHTQSARFILMINSTYLQHLRKIRRALFSRYLDNFFLIMRIS